MRDSDYRYRPRQDSDADAGAQNSQQEDAANRPGSPQDRPAVPHSEEQQRMLFGNQDAAIELVRARIRGLEAGRRDVATALRKAGEAFEAGGFEEAQQALMNAFGVRMSRSEAMECVCLLGQIWRQTGRSQEARSAFQAAITLAADQMPPAAAVASVGELSHEDMPPGVEHGSLMAGRDAEHLVDGLMLSHIGEQLDAASPRAEPLPLDKFAAVLDDAMPRLLCHTDRHAAYQAVLHRHEIAVRQHQPREEWTLRLAQSCMGLGRAASAVRHLRKLVDLLVDTSPARPAQFRAQSPSPFCATFSGQMERVHDLIQDRPDSLTLAGGVDPSPLESALKHLQRALDLAADVGMTLGLQDDARGCQKAASQHLLATHAQGLGQRLKRWDDGLDAMAKAQADAGRIELLVDRAGQLCQQASRRDSQVRKSLYGRAAALYDEALPRLLQTLSQHELEEALLNRIDACVELGEPLDKFARLKTLLARHYVYHGRIGEAVAQLRRVRDGEDDHTAGGLELQQSFLRTVAFAATRGGVEQGRQAVLFMLEVARRVAREMEFPLDPTELEWDGWAVSIQCQGLEKETPGESRRIIELANETPSEDEDDSGSETEAACERGLRRLVDEALGNADLALETMLPGADKGPPSA